MDERQVRRVEVGALVAVAVVYVVLLLPALAHARREQRDGQRRDALTSLKTDLEQYFNEHGQYPLTFDAAPYHYTVVEGDAREGATAWYLSAPLENAAPPQAGFDEERGRHYYWRIVSAGESTQYDICGGTLTCGAPAREPPLKPSPS